MKKMIFAAAALAASPALAHSGAHLHPHGAGTWLVVALAALTVVGTMVVVQIRGRK
ncbi:hypothetical protein [uncultured Shimia sp.]|uniref:hypothetical protein n=1 Tax=uncultured Shimia sp. TaxID=573152 RepID=UPI002603FF89|nr:hypothetical protein [uncultured Shimia sp.]